MSCENTLIIIPAHNEANSISEVITSLQAHGYGSILVVDDASTDDTCAIAKASGVSVMSLPYNLGRGKLRRQAFVMLSKKGSKKQSLSTLMANI
ncbi:glycosyltransferase family 2 protein [Pseudoalteromonas sp. GB56]